MLWKKIKIKISPRPQRRFCHTNPLHAQLHCIYKSSLWSFTPAWQLHLQHPLFSIPSPLLLPNTTSLSLLPFSLVKRSIVSTGAIANPDLNRFIMEMSFLMFCMFPLEAILSYFKLDALPDVHLHINSALGRALGVHWLYAPPRRTKSAAATAALCNYVAKFKFRLNLLNFPSHLYLHVNVFRDC